MKTTLFKLNMAVSNLRATINLIESTELGDEGEDIVDGLYTQLHKINSEIAEAEAQIREDEKAAA